MADASASKNPRGMNTKKDKEDMVPKTTFFSKLKRVGDTNIGTVDMIQLRDRLKEGQSSMAKKIYKCGIVQAAAFPPTLPCSELVMECASRLDIVTKSIIFDERKRVLANIGGQVVEEVFNIPQQKGMIVMLMDQAARFFQDSQDAYLALLKQNRLHEGKKGVTKSSRITKSDFKSEYGDLIVLLNRVMGSAQGMQFETWMYYFIEGIENGKIKFDWARIISENLELQLRTVQNQK